MSKQPDTPIASEDRRAGTYEHDDDVSALLWYGTHSILDVPRREEPITAGTARDRDLRLHGDGISGQHFVMRWRASGLVVTDDGSTNGTAYEINRNVGLALKALFDDKRDEGEGFLLRAGMTFVAGADPYRFVALDEEMRRQHPRLIEILGREDEVRTATEDSETPSPSDLILAADAPGHMVITGKPGCEQEELARIIHRISKRRRQPLIEVHSVPENRQEQSALLKQQVKKGTLVLDLGKNRSRLDPAFVSSMFSPSYPIRVIVLARTASHARRALGHQHWRPLMHVALCPLSRRRAAIPRLLDDWLAASGSVLRVADLSPLNQRALLRNPWRENLQALRQTAVRLDAIVRAGFSRKKAAAALGIPRMTFYGWFNETMQFVRPLVNEPQKSALLAKLSTDAGDRP